MPGFHFFKETDTHPEDFATACAFDPYLAAEYARHTGKPL